MSVLICLLLLLLLPTSGVWVLAHGLLPGLLAGEGYGVPPLLVLLAGVPRPLSGDLPRPRSADCPRPWSDVPLLSGSSTRPLPVAVLPWLPLACGNLHLSPNLHYFDTLS